MLDKYTYIKPQCIEYIANIYLKTTRDCTVALSQLTDIVENEEAEALDASRSVEAR